MPVPILYDPDWRATYRPKLLSLTQAAALVRPGNRVFISTACAEPQALTAALVQRASQLSDVEIIQLLALTDPFAVEDLKGSFLLNSFFIGKPIRKYIQAGLGYYTPILLSDIPKLFRSGQIPIQIAFIQVTPPDERGLVSLGIGVDIARSAVANAAMTIAVVNPHMPWTMGDSCLAVAEIDYLVECDTPLLAQEAEAIGEEVRLIGRHISSLIEDGSTLEFGIGHIPQALVEFLQHKKELGVHTEMLTDSIIDLVSCGAVTGSRKSSDPGRIVASFAIGSQRLYSYLDQNPLFCFRPSEYVNDAVVIAQQHKMVAINMAMEIDLTGQVCADSLGTSFYSGIGGQVDFNRGASNSAGGKAIIAMPATAQEGRVSRIVTALSPGAGVVTTRGEVHYVVTEFGVAYLHGKNIQDRALALIAIADPRFREQLFREAIGAKLLRQEFAGIPGLFLIPSQDVNTSLLLESGVLVNFRHLHPTDEPRLRELLYTLSRETIYYRFMSSSLKFTHAQIQNFVYMDPRKDVAVVATIPGAQDETIIALGRYYLDPATNRAEVALVLHDDWQSQGIGKFLFNHLVAIAKRNGIAGFTAEVLRDNQRMQQIIRAWGVAARMVEEEETCRYEIEFTP